MLNPFPLSSTFFRNRKGSNMQPAMHKNIGAFLKGVHQTTADLIVAGSGTDGIEKSGTGVDRTGYDSAMVAIVAASALTAAKTLVVSLTIQDSADNSSWADVAAALQPGGVAASTVITHSATGANASSYFFDVDLSTLRRYVRIQVLSELSHTSTDTAAVASCLILGGAEAPPVA